MRGYFGIGVEGISKEANLGNLVRSAHAFGASFFYTIAPVVDTRAIRTSDTADSFNHMPYYQYDRLEDFELPSQCQLVGIEFIEGAAELPSFRHPVRAAYVLGSEMGSLSEGLIEKCDFVIKIPMKFCVNVGVAGALVMYDRMISMGRFAERPVRTGGPPKPRIKKPEGLRKRKSRKILP